MQRELGDRNPFENAARLKQLETELAQTRDPGKRIGIQYQIIFEQLILGKPEETLATITDLHNEARAARTRLGLGDRRDIRLAEGLAARCVGRTG